ncbi:MAG: hypothetical protein EZS28_025113 [Streblomastix strix]|uniref:Uncharacterized protein n=1 Tax=Streblomastix strix TaxID=222440 RepID=A0A5J4VA95_9EUKA|nr:MAG: hypothetical protein EZS28_025113 [Streblomastix strix]
MNQCPECPECPESQAELLGFPPYQTYCHIVQFRSQFERLVNRNKQVVEYQYEMSNSENLMALWLMADLRLVQLVTQDTQDTQDTSLF